MKSDVRFLAVLLGFGLVHAVAAEEKGQSFSNMLVVPTDVRKISYPYDFEQAVPATVTVSDPYCAIKTDTVAFPADYRGVFPLPTIKGAPLPANIRRGAAVKDYWNYGRTNPATNQGCQGDIKQAFAATLDHFVRLGVDHVNVSQYAFLIDAARPELGLTRPSMMASDMEFIAGAAASHGLTVHQNMQIAGADTGTVPPNPVSAEWAGRFLDGWSNFVVDQAKQAATYGFEAIQIDFCCFPVDLTPHAARMRSPSVSCASAYNRCSRVRYACLRATASRNAMCRMTSTEAENI
jgi:hypothetical protein